MRRSHAEAIVSHETTTNVIHSSPIAGSDLGSKQIVQCIHDAAADGKGIETVVLDVSKNFGLADYFVVLAGRSDRHVQGLANKIIEALEKNGSAPFSVQGMEEGHWVVIDAVDVVVHIFYEPLRDRYDLENLWLHSSKVSLTKTPVLV